MTILGSADTIWIAAWLIIAVGALLTSSLLAVLFHRRRRTDLAAQQSERDNQPGSPAGT